MKFIHLTDPHLVAAPRKLYALDPRERLARAVADINRCHPDAAFVAITGDLVHFGELEAYRDLKAILADLLVPCHLLIGNHDSRENFLAVFRHSPVDPAGFVQYVVETPIADCIMLDSVDAGRDGGRLCARRLAWLANELTKRRDRPVYLFLHHTPCPIGIPGMDAIGLEDVDQFYARLEAHGDVRQIFFGHVHRPICGSWRGIPYATLPATSHQVLLQFHVPVEVPGSHEAPAYGVVLAEPDGMAVHIHSYADGSRHFLLDDKAAEAAQSMAELPPLAPSYEMAAGAAAASARRRERDWA